MPSKALAALKAALIEVDDLERGNPSKLGLKPVDPRLTRAIGRASIVLLSSHFERYIRAVNEEVTEHINAAAVSMASIPELIKLLHARPAIEELSACAWENRGGKLKEFQVSDGWLWLSSPASGRLEHSRILLWMKSPKPDNLVRFYRYWQIDDIFRAITSKDHTMRDFRLRLGELVNKRNNIAHGDPSVEATQQDIRLLRGSVWSFCERADRKLAQQVRITYLISPPWA